MYHKVRSIKELADSAMKALASRSSRGEGCAAGQGQDGKVSKFKSKEDYLNSNETLTAGLEIAQGKGNSSEVPRDNRGDDSLYLIYTAEELRWILKETGIKSEIPEPPLGSPYSTGSGVVLSMANNPDEKTGSRAQVYGGFWDNDAADDCWKECCVTQYFRRKRAHESVWACFEDLPLGRHTYALGIGYSIEDADLLLTVEAPNRPNLNRDYDAWMEKVERQVRRGVLVTPFKMTALNVDFLFSGPPLIAVFDYECRPKHFALQATLEVEVPNMFFQHTLGFFHHLQLVQID